MLFRALRGIENGFYIDVGAQDPVADSVTKAFYDRGWNGINIEPSQHWYEELRRDRPRDVNLQLAASDHRGTLHFYDIAGTGLSTTQPELVPQGSGVGREVTQYEVECRTLDEICADHGVELVHFLKIDVEGAEGAVLNGMPLDRVRPWIIVIEATLPNSQTPAWQEWQPLLDAHGYACVYEDGLNRFYLSPEHRELQEAFRFPPNIFDEFVSQRFDLAIRRLATENERREAALVQMRAALTAQKVDLKAMEAELVRQSRMLQERDALVAKHDQSLRERDALIAKQDRSLRERDALIATQDRSVRERDALIAQQGQDLQLMHAELGRLRSEIDIMHGEAVAVGAALDHQRGEIKARDQVIAELYVTVRALHASTSWRLTAPLRAASSRIRRATRIIARTLLHVMRPPARMARPLLRRMAHIPWLRASARMLFDKDSRIATHARLFLFGSKPSNGISEAVHQNQLSRSSRRVLGEIHALLGKTPRKPR